jgi:hypothetical protein
MYSFSFLTFSYYKRKTVHPPPVYVGYDCSIFSFLCSVLFVLSSLFFLPYHYLSFIDLRIFIILLISSNVSLLNFLLLFSNKIRVITKLPNSEQSNKGKVKTHKYINRQNQSTTENCETRCTLVVCYIGPHWKRVNAQYFYCAYIPEEVYSKNMLCTLHYSIELLNKITII